MANEKNMTTVLEENNEKTTPQALSDESRVKVMSPSMLVFKRFIRNKLAVIGFIILAVMFLFSFVGPIFSPYEEAQQFKYNITEFSTFAEFKMSDQYTFFNTEGAQIPDVTRTLSMSQLFTMTNDFAKLNVVSADGKTYFAARLGAGSFELLSSAEVARYTKNADGTYTLVSSTEAVPAGAEQHMASTLALSTDGSCKFLFNGFAADGITPITQNYIAETVTDPANPTAAPTVVLGKAVEECVATTLVFHDVEAGSVAKLSEAEKTSIVMNYYAMGAMQPVGTYTCDAVNANGEMLVKNGGTDVVALTPYVINAKNAGEFIAFELKTVLAAEANKLAAAKENSGSVERDEDGKTVTYKLDKVTDNYAGTGAAYQLKKEAVNQLLDKTAAPSSKHLLGTDTGARDVMTRLMYGGRVSLMVGFVVVGISLVIGVIMGGIAGYFSGWVDVIIMRFIELFNCIPFYPMMMIIGSILDQYDISPQARIYLLMVLLGVLNWPGIARIVRAQILSLREQDFIVATEACGIPVSRRIFRHLIPNVVPLLIVNATMSLGGIIITEATLSFLGLGVKHPAASWGSIINQAQDSFVLNSYPWIWIPAGILILLTVLGFNFVGDGLRDAFDPKMKR